MDEFELEQYSGSISGSSYLFGKVFPWQDYLALRTDQNTSICVYGNCTSVNGTRYTFAPATVRTVVRTGNMSSTYNCYENTYNTYTVSCTDPYYAYGNVIGVNYDLPLTGSITAMFIAGSVTVLALVSVFRVIFSLRRSVR